MRYLISFLFLSTISLSFAQELSDYGLQGQVKTVTRHLKNSSFGQSVTRMNFDKKGKMTERIHYKGEMELDYRELYSYDKKGHLVEQITEYPNGKNTKRTWSYSPTGKMLGWKVQNEAGKVEQEGVKKYNEQEQEIEFILTDYAYQGENTMVESYLYTYKYDEQGKRIEERSYGANGSLERVHLSEYDPAGNEILRTDSSYTYHSARVTKNKYDSKNRLIETKNFDNGKFNLHQKMSYDEQGNQTQVVYFDSNGNETKKIVRSYDERNNETGYETFQKDDSQKYKYDISNTYDEHQNVISYEMSQWGKVTKSYQAEIIYY
ncbi:MAG: hypothetical protein EP338_03585 [Bacteroidetes bacterium]|nr:MAG: hypothetical protein EP338_03585 [Bacteroidota bacterium]